MAVSLKREKRVPTAIRLAYLIQRIPLVSPKRRLRFFLDLAWFAERMSHEYSFQVLASQAHPIRHHSVSFLEQHLSAEQTVLDVGCGSGELASQISRLVKKLICIDHNAENIRLAKAQNYETDVEILETDALRYLESSPNQVDVVLLSHILEHIDNPAEFLCSLTTFCNFMYIEVPDFEKDHLGAYRVLTNSSLLYTDVDHVTEFDRALLWSVLKDAGLAVIEAEYRHGVIRLWCQTTSR
jgi:SAM-dependent methyltransferase